MCIPYFILTYSHVHSSTNYNRLKFEKNSENEVFILFPLMTLPYSAIKLLNKSFSDGYKLHVFRSIHPIRRGMSVFHALVVYLSVTSKGSTQISK